MLLTRKKTAIAISFLWILSPLSYVYAQDAVAPADSGVPANQPDPALQQQQSDQSGESADQQNASQDQQQPAHEQEQQQPNEAQQGDAADPETITSITGGEDMTAGVFGTSEDSNQEPTVIEIPAADASDQNQVESLLKNADNPSSQNEDSFVNETPTTEMTSLPDATVDNENQDQQTDTSGKGSSLDESLPSDQAQDQAQQTDQSPDGSGQIQKSDSETGGSVDAQDSSAVSPDNETSGSQVGPGNGAQ